MAKVKLYPSVQFQEPSTGVLDLQVAIDYLKRIQAAAVNQRTAPVVRNFDKLDITYEQQLSDKERANLALRQLEQAVATGLTAPQVQALVDAIKS